MEHTTNMKAEIKLITPELASELLKMNVGNRRLKPIKNVYADQMKNGGWAENGESIIIDKNGYVKDGQHRLNAVIQSGHSYFCVVVTGVDPNVMETIDVGANRSLSDILELNGFHNFGLLSAVVKAILGRKESNKFSLKRANRQSATSHVSNAAGLKFALDNKVELLKLTKAINNLYGAQPQFILSPRDIGMFLYGLGGFDFGEVHMNFIKMISGVRVDPDSCTSWLYKKLLNSKVNRIRLDQVWKQVAIIKVWNIYSQTDIPISNLHVSITENPEILAYQVAESVE